MWAEGVSFRHAVELLRDGMPATGAGQAPKRSTVRKLASPVERTAADHELLARWSITTTGYSRSRRTPSATWRGFRLGEAWKRRSISCPLRLGRVKTLCLFCRRRWVLLGRYARRYVGLSGTSREGPR
jgi:hypothetical protein